MRKLKLYLETSVWNFYYADDAPEKKAITRIFFENLLENEFEIYISDAVLAEFEKAPVDKQKLLLELVDRYQPIKLESLSSIEDLASQYLQRQALPQRAIFDATHIAFGTVYEFDYVVSWNLRHIANARREARVIAINMLYGYTKWIQLITPMKVSNYGEIED